MMTVRLLRSILRRHLFEGTKEVLSDHNLPDLRRKVIAIIKTWWSYLRTKWRFCFMSHGKLLRVMLDFHEANIVARATVLLMKLNSFLLSSTWEFVKQKKKVTRATMFAKWKSILTPSRQGKTSIVLLWLTPHHFIRQKKIFRSGRVLTILINSFPVT